MYIKYKLYVYKIVCFVTCYYVINEFWFSFKRIPVEIGRFEEINNQDRASIVQDNKRHFGENQITW